MATFNVTNYNVQIHSGANSPAPSRAFIGLNLVETGPVTSQAVAFLTFYPEATAQLPANSVRNQGGMRVYDANFHEHWFPLVLDLLRNEKPMTLFFNEATKDATVATGTQEPVGEGEQ